jgi:hypothetical protein
MAAVHVLSLTLMWFEDQVADDNEEDVLNLARQISALRTTADTEAGRRLTPILLLLRLQCRELQVRRMQLDVAAYQAGLNVTLGEGRLYLARLRAVILAYQPGRTVHMPLEFPRASVIFDGIDVDELAVEDVLVHDLGVSDLTRRRLMGHIPQ